MSISEFSALMQSEVYKTWLKQLEKNIATSTVDTLRSAAQRAEKTDFYIDVKTIQAMYKNVTNKELSNTRAKTVIRKIAQLSNSNLVGSAFRINKSAGVFFENIGFDTISSRVASVFDELEGVQEAYQVARNAYFADKEAEINKLQYSKASEKQTALDKAEKLSRKIGFGEFLHKDHVISIATNSTKDLRNSIAAADAFNEQQKNLLLSVLDKYISKLQQDDLASANLPNPINQELYAKYIKSSSKYLVEIQLKTTNIASGSASLPIITEMRKIFTTTDKDVENILNKSPTLNTKLLSTKGSLTWLELLVKDLASVMTTGKRDNKEYAIPLTLISRNSVKVTKSSNKANIAKLKAQKQKISGSKKSVAADPRLRNQQGQFTSLASLQTLLNLALAQQIQQNMGTGTSKNVLNYRSGRFAESAQVTSLSQSREGMITAFYTYQRNPYGTFSEGGAQSAPRSRDPKLLISKSVREVLATQVNNRLRAVLA